MSIRDELLKWANDEQVRGNPVSIQEIAEHAQGLAQKQEAGALRLLADIRIAAGDPHGRLMQDELVDHIAELSKKAAENDALAAHVERLTTSAHRLVNELYLDDDEGLLDHSERMREAIEAVRAEPETSLARLKARWQAEALEDYGNQHFGAGSNELRGIQADAKRLRRQAEAQPHSMEDV